MDTVIVLAAGKAERLGEPKALKSVAGRSWLAWQLERLAAAGLRDVIVVVGFRADLLVSAFAEWNALFQSRCPGGRLRLAVNPTPEWGPFSSLQTGLALLKGQGAFVLPVDTPAPLPEVWGHLKRAVTEGASAAIPTWNGRGGHPVCLGRRAAEEALSWDARDKTSRLNVLLRTCDAQRCEVDDARVAFNMNSRSEWESLAPFTLASGLMDITLRERASMICLRDDHWLVLKSKDPLSGAEYFFPPGGGIEKGETAAQAGVREVFEETGYSARTCGSHEDVSSYFFAWNGRLLYLTTHFLLGEVTSCDEPPFHPDDPSLVERVWAPLSELRNLQREHPGIMNGVVRLLESSGLMS